MKAKQYYLQLQPWHFVVAIVFFYFTTLFISEVKLKEMPEATVKKSFPSFTGEFSENEYSFIFFYNDDSDLCNKMRYNVEQFAAKNGKEEIAFFEVNVNELPEYYYRYNISGVPNLLIFKNDKELTRIMGIVPESNLEKIHQKIIRL